MILTSCQSPLFPTYNNKNICTPPPKAPLFSDADPLAEDPSAYQVGDTWNRHTMEDPKDFPYQVLQLYRTGMGAVGTGVYLGQFAGQHIVMTAAHVYPELQSCFNEVNFLVRYKSLRFYVTCSQWHYKFAQNDIMLFAITTENEEHLNLLKPVTFSTIHQSGEALRLVSIDNDDSYNFLWNIDDQKDCKLLSSREQLLEDPDCSEQSTSLRSWSLPIGCDGKHGDSGAPVYDQDLRLKGLLWTGKFPKLSASSAQLLQDFEAQSDNLWKEYNYMVPITSLEQEIDEDLAQKFHLHENSRDILRSLSEKIKEDRKSNSLNLMTTQL